MSRSRIPNNIKVSAIRLYVCERWHPEAIAAQLKISLSFVQGLIWPLKPVETEADRMKGRVCIDAMKLKYIELGLKVFDGGGFSLKILEFPDADISNILPSEN